MRNWTREEEIMAFNLYCKIPFQKVSKNHPEVIRVARIIGRTPSSVGMKIGNFGSFDPRLKEKGIVGLANASKLDQQIWEEFNGKWDELAFLSEQLINGEAIPAIQEERTQPTGQERLVVTRQRVNQDFFRGAILASYNNACCITGLSNPELLIASHIKPWKDSDEAEKTNPQNGLCLNALHDKAFDRGLITITQNYQIKVSKSISDIVTGEAVQLYFMKYDGENIRLPEKFVPDKRFLEYHNDCIFEGWRKNA